MTVYTSVTAQMLGYTNLFFSPSWNVKFDVNGFAILWQLKPENVSEQLTI